MHLYRKYLNFDLRNKTSVLVFYRGNKIWVRVRVYMNSLKLSKRMPQQRN